MNPPFKTMYSLENLGYFDNVTVVGDRFESELRLALLPFEYGLLHPDLGKKVNKVSSP